MPRHRIAAALAIAVALLALLATAVSLAGQDPSRALRALWEGAFGSSYVLASVTLVRAVPLVLGGLAVAIAFRAGVWNIGVEGQILAGAASSTAIAMLAPRWPAAVAIPAVLAAGALAGAGWAGIAALLRRRFGVLEVISTIMLNFIALYSVGYLVRGPLQEPSGIYPQSPEIAAAFQLPRLVEGTRLHWGLLIALVAAVALWWYLAHTAGGFRIRAVGASPAAAQSAGTIDVGRTTTRAFLASGALAGLAGAIEVTGVTFALYETISPGYGYTSIAVALLAGLNPLFVVLSGIMFGALEAGAGAMQRDAGVPSVLVSVITATLILIVLAARTRRLSPA
jgi:simple sugar transport system permease protein